jgi:hypothetical protein
MRSSSAAAVALLAIALTVGVASGLSLILQHTRQSALEDDVSDLRVLNFMQTFASCI